MEMSLLETKILHKMQYNRINHKNLIKVKIINYKDRPHTAIGIKK